MKYLVTGGCGFIGSHLSEQLLKDGHQVIIIDNLSTGSLSNIEHLKKNSNLIVIKDNVQHIHDLEGIIKNSDGVFHLAASVGVKNIIDHTLTSFLNTMDSGHRVLSLASKFNKKVLLASSSEVYGLSKKKSFSETDSLVLGPSSTKRWSYAAAKIAEEHLALAYSADQHLPVVIVRLFNTVGQRQSSRYGMVIPTFIEQAKSNKPLSIFGDGTQARCFTDVSDVVIALAKLIETESAYGEIVNIGGTELTTINELADKIINLTGSRSKKQYIPYSTLVRKGYQDMPYRKPNIQKAVRLIDFHPTDSLDNILKNMI